MAPGPIDFKTVCRLTSSAMFCEPGSGAAVATDVNGTLITGLRRFGVLLSERSTVTLKPS